MTTVAQPRSARAEHAALGARLIEFVYKAPIHLALILISVLWLVPTVGLFVTSFRTRRCLQL